MARFKGVYVYADGSYTETDDELNNPNLLVKYHNILEGDAILDTETGQLVNQAQIEALCDEYNEVDVWALRKQNAEMRALLERLAAYAKPATSVVWNISAYIGSPESCPLYLGSAGQGDDADVFDVIADICEAMQGEEG